MRPKLAAVFLLAACSGAACSDNPVGTESFDESGVNGGVTTPTSPSLAVSTGEVFSFLTIDNPAGSSLSIPVGSSYQMSGTLHYSAGGVLPSTPYATWRSTDNCVATVTSASPSWGLVRGVASGTARIIVEVWGKADTVAVTVQGSSPPSSACYEREWTWNYNDVSFTGTPLASTQWHVGAGERLTRIVLFAGPKPDYTIGLGSKVTLKSELWYDRGGKIGGRGYVTFSVTDGSVASINSNGVATGLSRGRTKVIARLGSLADTVPLYVR